MRALGSLLLVLAQLRPVVGIILCALTTPATPADAGECSGGEHASVPAQAPMGHDARWDAPGAPTGPSCGLAELCTPLGQATLANTVSLTAPVPVTSAVIAVVGAGPLADLSAPPTPPPNA